MKVLSVRNDYQSDKKKKREGEDSFLHHTIACLSILTPLPYLTPFLDREPEIVKRRRLHAINESELKRAACGDEKEQEGCTDVADNKKEGEKEDAVDRKDKEKGKIVFPDSQQLPIKIYFLFFIASVTIIILILLLLGNSFSRCHMHLGMEAF